MSINTMPDLPVATKFIAEVSSNHHGSLDRCYAFIDKAAEIGCYAVKFQLFKIDELFSSEILQNSEMHRQRTAWELPLEFIPLLSQRCKEQGIKFSCTPFYLEAVQQLLPYVDFYKIASYELLWGDLLEACASSAKPVVLSTGMADMGEVEVAVETLRKAGCNDLSLLHCVSGYPTPLDECNLAAIETLRQRFNCKVGWSDHSVSPAVLYRAANYWRSDYIEFHLDLDGEGEEYASGHCWLASEIATVIDTLNRGQLADGDGIKQATASEVADRDWRADPSDGLRPLIGTRLKWLAEDE